ncbi:MAG: hypothetical protein AAGI52_16285 [Bacteroidota bacterium]
MRLLLVLLLLALSGCATYNIPPNTQVSTERTEVIEGSMGVVIGAISVEDTGGLAAHVGPGAPEVVYRALLGEVLPTELTRQSNLEEAFVGEAEGYNAILEAQPSAGATLIVDGRTPDWLLILKSVTLLRAKYNSGGGMMVPTNAPGSGMTMSQGTESRAVRSRSSSGTTGQVRLLRRVW